jgi:hypothetical protein
MSDDDYRDFLRNLIYAMAPIGTIVYDEQVFPILQVALSRGRMRFLALVRAETTVKSEGEIRVHGDDGSLVFACASKLAGPTSCPPGVLMAFEVEGRGRAPDWPTALPPDMPPDPFTT